MDQAAGRAEGGSVAFSSCCEEPGGEQADGGKVGGSKAQAASLQIQTTESFTHGNFSVTLWRGWGVGDQTRRERPQPPIHSCDRLRFAEVLTETAQHCATVKSRQERTLSTLPSLPTYIYRPLSNAFSPPHVFLHLCFATHQISI